MIEFTITITILFTLTMFTVINWMLGIYNRDQAIGFLTGTALLAIIYLLLGWIV